jgi:hypothetical protein
VHPLAFYLPLAAPALFVLAFVGAVVYVVATGVTTTTTTIPPASSSEATGVNWSGISVGLIKLLGIVLLYASYVMQPAYRDVVYLRLLNLYAIEPNEKAQSRAKFIFRLMSLSLLHRVALRRAYRLMRIFESDRSRAGLM